MKLKNTKNFQNQLKKNIFSTKNCEMSVGINSFVPHNPIKVNNYKPNNINHLNSKKNHGKIKTKNFSAS